MTLETVLFNKEEINHLPGLKEIINLSVIQIIEDVINYWCHKNLKIMPYNKMNYKNWGMVLKEITPKTKDQNEFFTIISDCLKKSI